MSPWYDSDDWKSQISNVFFDPWRAKSSHRAGETQILTLESHTRVNRNECPCGKHFLTTPANTSILSLGLKNQNFKFVTLTRAPGQPVALLFPVFLLLFVAVCPCSLPPFPPPACVCKTPQDRAIEFDDMFCYAKLFCAIMCSPDMFPHHFEPFWMITYSPDVSFHTSSGLCASLDLGWYKWGLDLTIQLGHWEIAGYLSPSISFERSIALCWKILPHKGRVCVCNVWIDVKLPSFCFPLLPS